MSYNSRYQVIESKPSSDLFDIIVNGCIDTLNIAIEKGLLKDYDLKNTLQHKITQEKTDEIQKKTDELINRIEIFERERPHSTLINDSKFYLDLADDERNSGKIKELRVYRTCN